MDRSLTLLLDVFILLSIIPFTVYLKKLCYSHNRCIHKYFFLSLILVILALLSFKNISYGFIGIFFSVLGRRLCIPAITGGIGAGKTTLGKFLNLNGFYVIDSDSIGRQFLIPGTVGYKNLIKNFGDIILKDDGQIDKAVLREIVYNDKSKLKMLNKCLHTHIIYKIVWEVVKYRILKWKEFIVIEVPLLYETHLSCVCAPIIVCSASEETRLQRCQSRNSEISKDIYINIMKSQTPYDKLLDWGDVIIENESTLEDYYKTARVLMEEFLM